MAGLQPDKPAPGASIRTLSPISAEATKIMRMLSATLTAAHRLCAGKNFGVSVKKIEPHTTGFMTARTVTTACTIW
jgi:siderophore synthetase component